MAKRTQDENGSEDVPGNDTSIGTNVPTDAPAPSAAIEPSSEPDQKEWRGHPMYVCRDCGYNSLNRDRVIEHIRITHSGPAHLVTGYRKRTKGNG